MEVKFINVGRDKKSWSIQIDDNQVEHGQLVKSIKDNDALMSKEISFEPYTEFNDKFGIFVGGCRHIGDIQLLPKD